MQVAIKRLLYISLITCFCFSACSQQKTSQVKAINVGYSSLNASLFNDLNKHFLRKNKNIQSFFKKVSPDQAISKLQDGSLDLYIGSTEIPQSYASDFEKLLLAKDGMVMVTNPQNPLSNISSDNLAKVFSRTIKNWKEIGGEDKPIMLLDKEADSTEREIIYSSLFGASIFPVKPKIILRNKSELKSTLLKYPNALTYIKYSDLDADLKALSIDHIPASDQNISEGYFPLAHAYYIYYSPQLLRESKQLKPVLDFIDFLYGQKGQSVISAHGQISLTEAELELYHFNKNPIYIGVSVPTEGKYRELGRSVINAAKLAVEKRNNMGGIKARPVKLLVCNDKAEPEHAIKCARKFIEQNVTAVIGSITSQTSIEASKIYAENKIVQISPASTHPWFTERPASAGFAFRTSARDDQQARLLVGVLDRLELEHPTTVAIMHNNTIYGTTLSQLVEDQLLAKNQDELVSSFGFDIKHPEFNKVTSNLKAAVLIFIGEYDDGAQVLKSLSLNNKADVVFIGADGNFSDRFIEVAGLRAESAYVTGNNINEERVEQSGFRNEFKEKFKSDISAYVVNSYDAANIILNALQEASIDHATGEINKIDFAKKISQTKHQGLTGDISFDASGDPVSSRMSVYKVVNSEFVKQ